MFIVNRYLKDKARYEKIAHLISASFVYLTSKYKKSKQMKTGLIGAMQEEILMLKDKMQDVTVQEIGPRTYYSGKIGDHEIVMALSGWGKVAGASTASTLINCFDVDELVFIGLAGSLQAELNVGDIVVANKLIQHDVNLTLLTGFNDVKSPFWKDFVFDVDPQSFEKAMEATEQFVDKLKHGEFTNISDHYNPKIFSGTIGTGDQFVASHEGKAVISEKYPEILCTEMEGAAIAQVAADYQIPCTVIRIISDKADEEAHSSFADFLFTNISQISVELAKLIFK